MAGRVASVLLAAALALGAAGCGDDGGTPKVEDPGAGDLTSMPLAIEGDGLSMINLDLRAFVSQDVEGYELVEGTEIRVGFAGEQMVVAAGCNQMGGAFTIDGDQLGWTAGATMTEMGCDPARTAQDQWILGLLSEGVTATLAGDDLTLTRGDVTISLLDEVVAVPDEPLEGGVWTLETTVEGGIASSVPAGVAPPTLEFNADGHVAVFNGCNGGSGRFVLIDAGNLVTFGEVAATTMSCGPEEARLERLVTSVLTGDVPVRRTGPTITFIKGNIELTYRVS